MAHDRSADRSPDVVFEFEHDESAPYDARIALAPIVDADPLADHVNLVASELVSNVVRHTEDGGRLDAWNGNPFRVEVRDSSPDLPDTEAPKTEGGFGLRIVDALSSDWGAERSADGKVVWAELNRPAD